MVLFLMDEDDEDSEKRSSSWKRGMDVFTLID